MPERKLTRATIPMCPNRECNKPTGVKQVCPHCGYVIDTGVDWGYHAPDVSGVINEMRADAHMCRENGISITAKRYDDWADRLEGK